MPLETQREIAAERRATREAEWAKQGYLHVAYDGQPAKKPRPLGLGADSVLGDVFLFLLQSLGGKYRGRVHSDNRSRHSGRAA